MTDHEIHALRGKAMHASNALKPAIKSWNKVGWVRTCHDTAYKIDEQFGHDLVKSDLVKSGRNVVEWHKMFAMERDTFVKPN